LCGSATVSGQPSWGAIVRTEIAGESDEEEHTDDTSAAPAVLTTPVSANWFSRPTRINSPSDPRSILPGRLQVPSAARIPNPADQRRRIQIRPRFNTLVVDDGQERKRHPDSGGPRVLSLSFRGCLPATAAADASSGGVKAIDYGAWRGMKLVQIGSNVQAINNCGSRCQYGLPGNRMTVTFRSFGTGGEPIGNILALNRR
jgi:hypothetical protein